VAAIVFFHIGPRALSKYPAAAAASSDISILGFAFCGVYVS
jgi:hypothetical protein